MIAVTETCVGRIYAFTEASLDLSVARCVARVCVSFCFNDATIVNVLQQEMFLFCEMSEMYLSGLLNWGALPCTPWTGMCRGLPYSYLL